MLRKQWFATDTTHTIVSAETTVTVSGPYYLPALIDLDCPHN